MLAQLILLNGRTECLAAVNTAVIANVRLDITRLVTFVNAVKPCDCVCIGPLT